MIEYEIDTEGKTGPDPNTLWVGHKDGMVCLDHPKVQQDEHGVGHIIFSPAQARDLATILLRQAELAEERIAVTSRETSEQDDQQECLNPGDSFSRPTT